MTKKYTHTLYNDDCLNALKKMEDNSIDSCVTDPPYGLSFMGKGWDYEVPKKEIWEEVLRVLKPGGHLLAFFGSRTYHRGVVQIEDAGFDIRDQIMWVYGSGFPKSYDVSQMIEKKNTIGTTRRPDRNLGGLPRDRYSGSEEGKLFSDTGGKIDLTTEEAKKWQGWGTALKPSHEPIVMARKPFKGNVAENVMKHGTGAINIDGCRVELQKSDSLQNPIIGRTGLSIDTDITDTKWGFKSVGREGGIGRWPANLCHDGSDEVENLFPQTGKSAGGRIGNTGGGRVDIVLTGVFGKGDPGFGDSGSASRFFYCAKASKSERGEFNNHPTVKPIALMRWLCRMVTPKNGIILDPFMGSGSTGKAAHKEGFKFIGIEMNKEYFDIAEKRIKDDHESGLGKFFNG